MYTVCTRTHFNNYYVHVCMLCTHSNFLHYWVKMDRHSQNANWGYRPTFNGRLDSGKLDKDSHSFFFSDITLADLYNRGGWVWTQADYIVSYFIKLPGKTVRYLTPPKYYLVYIPILILKIFQSGHTSKMRHRSTSPYLAHSSATSGSKSSSTSPGPTMFCEGVVCVWRAGRPAVWDLPVTVQLWWDSSAAQA